MARKYYPFFTADEVAAATIADGSVTLAKLAAGVNPALIAVAGGTFTCAASTTNTITTSGLASTDIIVCFPTVLTTMTTTFKAVYASATTITVTSSAATLTTDKLFWVAYRAAA